MSGFLNQELVREGWHCSNCASSSRMRMVMYGLGLLLHCDGQPTFQWPGRKQIKILESSARGPYPMMLDDKFDYYATEYDPTGKETDTRKFADFQKMSYPDATFDIVIASDVFEHVRDDVAGYREVFRVLKPGGSFLLTVPYQHNQPQTIKRVDTSGATDVHLLEPEYHGGGGHTLTYRNYGRDLLSLLRSTGFSVGYLETAIPAYGIPSQALIIATKGDFVELPPRTTAPVPTESLGALLPPRLFLLYKYNLKSFMHYWRESLRK